MNTPTSRRRLQAGFSHIVGIAMVALVFGVIGFIGYKLYAHPARGGESANSKAGISKQNTSTDLSAADAPTIKKASDLDKASAVLDQVDTNAEGASDVSQLNNQLSSFAN